MANVENVIIVGSGPAGYTAALYTARANLNPLVIEGFLWGGLLQQTTDVENYPGYPEGIMGPEMMQQFRDQAERFGSRFITDNVTKIEPGAEGEPHTVWVDEDEYKARTVILAMGAEHKKLGVPGEEELGGRGVSYCATCDAAFYKDKTTLIVGGGDSAMEEAIFLAKFASRVTIVHRRDEFRASKIMLDRAKSTDNIDFLTPYVVDEFAADETGVLGVAKLRNPETGEQRDLPIVRRLHRDRPRAAVRARPGHRRDRRERLRRHRGQVDAHQGAGHVRGRRPRRPHLPPGGHRRGLRVSVRARRRVVPARQPARPDARRAAGHRRSRRGAVGAPDAGVLSVIPIGRVEGGRSEPVDDDWGAVEALIRLDDRFGPDALAGLDAFSNLEVVYAFHLVDEAAVEHGARHPRGNQDWPRVGIFAQRGKDRPNRIGVSRCELLGVDGLAVAVRGLDAVDGTPVLDLKPWMAEFGPRGELRQPAWASELMRGYW